jgi:RimJ/RimL family protein N-acetyltransferase
MREFPRIPIRTDGLVLREVTTDDADDVAAACADAETQQFLPELPSPYTRDDALDWITNRVAPAWAKGEAHFAMADPSDDRLLGVIGMGALSPGGVTAVGYWVAPWARGRHVATRATRALATWAFAQSCQRIEVFTQPTNVASMRVAWESGFHHEGIRRAASTSRDGGRRDLVAWSRIRADDGRPLPRDLPDLPGGQLTDGMVTLTAMTGVEADNVYALKSLPEVVATTVAPSAPTHESVAERCAAAPYQWLIGNRAECVIRDAVTGAFAGDIGLHLERPTGSAMVGYSVLREWRGRRYAERAVRLISKWAFGLGIARVVAGTAPGNIASQRTLERAGFVQEGYERSRLPGPPGAPRIDNVAYALLPGEMTRLAPEE